MDKQAIIIWCRVKIFLPCSSAEKNSYFQFLNREEKIIKIGSQGRKNQSAFYTPVPAHFPIRKRPGFNSQQDSICPCQSDVQLLLLS